MRHKRCDTFYHPFRTYMHKYEIKKNAEIQQAALMHKTNTFSYTLITSFSFTELCITLCKRNFKGE